MRNIVELAIADHLRFEVKHDGPVDVGPGAESLLDTTPESLKHAIDILKEEGYEARRVKLPCADDPEKLIETDILCTGEEDEGYEIHELRKLGEIERLRIINHTLLAERRKDWGKIAKKLHDRGMSYHEIAEIIDIPESSVLFLVERAELKDHN